MKWDRAFLFDSIRSSLFNGRMSQKQVDGINAIMDAIEAEYMTDDRYVSYLLATIFHECARTMQPIVEFGKPDYFKKYDGRKDLGNDKIGDGYRYRGRGYCQLTGKRNYSRASDAVGLNLVAAPDLALRPDLAAKIMICGMCQGWFTGKKLSDYFKATTTDFFNARRIINGTDKAETIAGYAVKFRAALKPMLAAPSDIPAEPPSEPVQPDLAVEVPEIVPEPETSPGGVWARLLAMLGWR